MKQVVKKKFYQKESGLLSRCSDQAVGWTIAGKGFGVRQGQYIFLFC